MTASAVQNCLEALYPPGKCGRECATSEEFQCRTREVQQACCPVDFGHQSCSDGAVVPDSCSLECAVVFSPFMTDCGDAMAANAPTAMTQYRSFARRCNKQDPYELVHMADRMIKQGCEISLPAHGQSSQGHRLMQDEPVGIVDGGMMHIGGWMDWDNIGCPWDRFDERAAEVVEVCCGEESTSLVCQNGNNFPTSCSIECAVVFHSFHTYCNNLLHHVMDAEHIADFDQFEGMCMAKGQVRAAAPLCLSFECFRKKSRARCCAQINTADMLEALANAKCSPPGLPGVAGDYEGECSNGRLGAVTAADSDGRL